MNQFNFSISYAITCLSIYDYFVTLEAEVERIWSRKLGGATALFFLNRYVPLLNRAIAMAIIFTWNDKVLCPNVAGGSINIHYLGRHSMDTCFASLCSVFSKSFIMCARSGRVSCITVNEPISSSRLCASWRWYSLFTIIMSLIVIQSR
ncbi:hypothetical protein AcV5_002417 [Taiwanofungus camphoratus]|nr:hypothetical protein AcV5_002417 [Antrodia cinnamomea]